MKSSEVKDILMEMLDHKCDRKYLGKREKEAIRIALSCVETMDKLKNEWMSQWWNEYEVRG